MFWLLLHPGGHPQGIPSVPKEIGNELGADAKRGPPDRSIPL
jgi:hypothetical protein